ncbi:MAG: ABC transporter permease, partial [Planctomycetota bacterium]
MRVILSLALKDLVLLVRDKMSMFFVLIFPVLFGLFTGAVFMGLSKAPPLMKIGVIDEDRSKYSQLFVEEMHEVRDVSPVESTLADAENGIRTGEISGYIRIPAGFGEDAGRIVPDPPTVFIKADPASFAAPERVRAVVFQVMLELAKERLKTAPVGMPAGPPAGADLPPPPPGAADVPLRPGQPGWLQGPGAASSGAPSPGRTGSDRPARTQAPTGPGAQARDGYRKTGLVRVEVLEPEDPGELTHMDALIVGASSPFGISFPQAMIWGIVGCVASFAASLVREKERGTYVRLRSAPIRPWTILVGKGLAMFVSMMAILGLLVVLGSFLGVKVTGWGKLAVVVLVLGYCFVGIMMALSVLGRT